MTGSSSGWVAPARPRRKLAESEIGTAPMGRKRSRTPVLEYEPSSRESVPGHERGHDHVVYLPTQYERARGATDKKDTYLGSLPVSSLHSSLFAIDSHLLADERSATMPPYTSTLPDNCRHEGEKEREGGGIPCGCGGLLRNDGSAGSYNT
ncbi:hypothetical protein THAOC_04466 [Thalassiosira oceanica]|uniref:Uncharacterized protein n=1 Tax=Thalassiosira oceanica TaxID=159749 RepID=K0T8I0_THAOC|nr:hypothetical protein THAOC_04466 [Thalassiosira oceanica]|eukprot:EJK73890.1 hypothetical protein THAOC_04466 [Thalassiosira oceanica]